MMSDGQTDAMDISRCLFQLPYTRRRLIIRHIEGHLYLALRKLGKSSEEKSNETKSDTSTDTDTESTDESQHISTYTNDLQPIGP